MASVGLFFGSDTGNTEHVAKMIQKELGKQLIDVKDIAKSSKEDIAEFAVVDLNNGEITWFNGYYRSFGDVRDLENARNTVNKLFEEFPG